MTTRAAPIQRCACGQKHKARLSPAHAFGPQPVQRTQADPRRGLDAEDVHPGVLRPSSGGAPLPGSVRERMERALGHDFADVRVHHGGEAESIGAVAFTRGTHLHFAPGRYQPHSAEGQRLLGHELAHVMQQRARRVPSPGGPVPINDSAHLEREAETAAAQVSRSGAFATPATRGRPPTAHAGTGAAIQPMMEEEDDDGAAAASPPAPAAGRNVRPPPTPAPAREAIARGAANPGRGGRPVAAHPVAKRASAAAVPVVSWAQMVVRPAPAAVPKAAAAGRPASAAAVRDRKAPIPHEASAAATAPASAHENAGPAGPQAGPVPRPAEMAAASPAASMTEDPRAPAKPVMSWAQKAAAAAALPEPPRPAKAAAVQDSNAPIRLLPNSRAHQAAGNALLNSRKHGSAAVKDDWFHTLPDDQLQAAANGGTHFRIVGRDGVKRTLTQHEHTLPSGVPGIVEYIVDSEGKRTHQRFIQGGTINGAPNQ